MKTDELARLDTAIYSVRQQLACLQRERPEDLKRFIRALGRVQMLADMLYEKAGGDAELGRQIDKRRTAA